jgi:ubiquinone/menaquinone biosynthesis C-methylase UbiE
MLCEQVAQELSECVTKNKARVLDMCCGVGISTRALRQAFPEAEAVIGLDTSPQMVAMANFLSRHLAIVSPLFQPVLKRLDTSFALLEEQRSMLQAGHRCRGVHFKKGNAQDTRLPNQSFDLVTVMYAFHEAPREGRDRIIKEARRLLSPGGVLAIVDISADYEPSETMLAGEPYVLEYQQNIRDQLLHMKGFVSPKYKTLVPGRVDMWTLRRSWT